MISNVVARDGLQETFVNGELTNQIVKTAWQKAFSFSGFGAGDGKHPVAGGFYVDEVRYPHGSIRWAATDGSQTIDTVGFLHGKNNIEWATPPKVSLSPPEAVALGRLYSDIRGTAPDLGVALGERKETAELLHTVLSTATRPLTTAGNLIKKLGGIANEIALNRKNLSKVTKAMSPKAKREVRRRNRNANKVLNDLAKKALGINLALKPLASELDNAVHHIVDVSHQTHSAKGSATTSSSYRMNLAKNSYLDVSDSIRIQYGVKYYISDPELFEYSRLGLTNPLGIAWELVPLSFVVDYFFNIGRAITILHDSLGIGLQFISGYKTVTSRAIGKGFQDWIDTSNPNGTTHYTTEFGGVTSTKTRTVLVSFPVTTRIPFTPPVRASNAASRLVTLTSLIKLRL